MAEDVVLTQVDGPVGIVRLNRPRKLNALSGEVMDRLVQALEGFDADPEIRVMVLTGDERAFAAGADIGDMAHAGPMELYLRDQFARWERLRRLRKPLVAAVSGYALGGGNELAMLCDVIIASETAVFGQPEISIGIMPGAGGTQRLTRAVGKAVAMDVILTGRFLTAAEAHRLGLVSRLVPQEHYYTEALRVAREMARKPPLALRLAKEAVLKAHELGLPAGLEYERKLFYLLFATEDQKEGMQAFLEKRKPEFRGK